MDFGAVSVNEAEGAVLAHSFGLSSGRVTKGRVLTAADIQRFRDAGVESVTVARLGSGDVAEDAAAHRLAEAVAGVGVRLEKAVGGRVNLMAQHYGVLTFDRKRLDALNTVDESMTLATLEPYAAVEPGQMIGTVKVVPFSVENETLRQAEECAKDLAFGVAAAQPHRMGLIQTLLPGTATKVLDKTSDVLRHRVEGLGSCLVHDDQCNHDIVDLARAIKEQVNAGMELVLVVGASAVADRRDVIPAAIEKCSGAVEHFGIPVDPGNLLLLGRVGDVPVLGVPGCARSPKHNGFDWVLQRLVCGLPVSSGELMAMGTGGLLKEIAGRPMPRAATPTDQLDKGHRVHVLVLAAGGATEILESSGAEPNISHVVDAAMKSAGKGVYVVTGAQEEEVTTALQGFAVSYAYNPAFSEGISTSLRRGLSALPADADGVVVCLGNDPAPSSAVIDSLIEAFDPNNGCAICMPMRNGRRGIPLLIGRQFFAELHELEGDIGARYLVGAYPLDVCEVSVDSIPNSTDQMVGAVTS